jgi:hypothetical protein
LLEDEKAGQVVELKTGKGKMASFMQKFGRKILLDEPVVRRWNSLPLLWSCKVRLAETWISISMRIRKNMDENAWVSLSKLASTIHVQLLYTSTRQGAKHGQALRASQGPRCGLASGPSTSMIF